MPSTYASAVRDEPRASSSATVVYPDEPNDQDYGEDTHDYTEGAKESEIAEAIEIRGRGAGARHVHSTVLSDRLHALLS